MQSDPSLKAVEAVTRNLKPEQRQQAFEFAMEVALADGLLTSKKKNTLQTLANKLELDNAFVGQKLANI